MTAAPRLSALTVPDLPGSVAGPPTGRAHWQQGIVHLGIGAFHRAHQAHYTQDAAVATEDERWAILGVTQRSASVVEQLRPQDGLYGVLLAGTAGESLQMKIGSVRDAAFPAEETARVLDAIADPQAHIVSLTITEKGYCRNAAGRLDLDREDVRSDVAALAAELAAPASQPGSFTPARTAVGLLGRGLAARFRSGGQALTVLPCDNLMDNGRTTRDLVHEFIEAAPGSGVLLDWVRTDVAFPGTMVDRIVPATTAAHRERAQALTGLADEGLVVAEPFRQWVIEDLFAGPRPAWENVGAQLTDDVAIYERTKSCSERPAT